MFHYNKWAKHGDPLWQRPDRPPCMVEECRRPRKVRGLCELHARRASKGKPLEGPPRGSIKVPCLEQGCTRDAYSAGRCNPCYQRNYRRTNAAQLATTARVKYEAIPEAERRAERAEYYRVNRDHIRGLAKVRYEARYPDDPAPWRAAKARRRSHQQTGMSKTDRDLSLEYRRAIRHDPCRYCGAPGEQDDHYYPLHKGGTDHWWNLVRACAWCNNSKNARCGTWFLLTRGPNSTSWVGVGG